MAAPRTSVPPNPYQSASAHIQSSITRTTAETIFDEALATVRSKLKGSHNDQLLIILSVRTPDDVRLAIERAIKKSGFFGPNSVLKGDGSVQNGLAYINQIEPLANGLASMSKINFPQHTGWVRLIDKGSMIGAPVWGACSFIVTVGAIVSAMSTALTAAQLDFASDPRYHRDGGGIHATFRS
jgi:hypothetical protein